jgi:hypothetical protein
MPPEGIPPPDGIPPPGILTPPLAPPESLQAAAKIAVKATNKTGFNQLGMSVDARRDVIVLTLCIAQTIRGLEHEKRSGVPSESLPGRPIPPLCACNDDITRPAFDQHLSSGPCEHPTDRICANVNY